MPWEISLRKIPTTAVPLLVPEVLRSMKGMLDDKYIARFERKITEWLGVKDAVLVNKGTTALYLILKVLKELHPDKNEVIYPAYTVPTLKLAFDRVGLVTKVCDISRATFNMNPELLKEAITPRTLAVIPVHMFGFPMRLEKLFEVCKNDICVIEDACQAPGAKIDGKLVGSFAHCAIFSLCKGKNISTFSGGFAVFNDSKLAQIVRTERDKLAGQSSSLKLLALLIAYALAMRPGVYGFLYPLIKRFKSEELHRDFSALKYTSMQSVVGEILLEKLEMVNAQRRVHGLYMYEGLKDCSHLMLPAILPGTEAVFNHLPVVFLNENDRNRTQKLLWDKGIDTARMYMKPNHHIYDLGYPHSAFPDATLVAEGLVTLPTHPFMHQRDLETMVEVARKS